MPTRQKYLEERRQKTAFGRLVATLIAALFSKVQYRKTKCPPKRERERKRLASPRLTRSSANPQSSLERAPSLPSASWLTPPPPPLLPLPPMLHHTPSSSGCLPEGGAAGSHEKGTLSVKRNGRFWRPMWREPFASKRRMLATPTRRSFTPRKKTTFRGREAKRQRGRRGGEVREECREGDKQISLFLIFCRSEACVGIPLPIFIVAWWRLAGSKHGLNIKKNACCLSTAVVQSLLDFPWWVYLYSTESDRTPINTRT